jgi:hypothetical protein
LPDQCTNITFDFLENNMKDENEITNYLNLHYDYESFSNILNLLKNIRNDYII